MVENRLYGWKQSTAVSLTIWKLLLAIYALFIFFCILLPLIDARAEVVFLGVSLVFVTILIFSVREGIIYMGGRPTEFSKSPRLFLVMISCYSFCALIFFVTAFI